MLLLVLETELDQAAPALLFVPADQKGLQGGCDAMAPGLDLGHRRPAQQSTLWSWLPWSEGLVIGIEQIAPARVGLGVLRPERFQDEGLEKPGGVGQVPFRRAGILHALQAEVFGFQRGDQSFALLPHRQQPLQQGAGGHGFVEHCGRP